MLARSAHARNRTNRIRATPIIRLYFTPGDSRRCRAAPLLHVCTARKTSGGPALAGRVTARVRRTRGPRLSTPRERCSFHAAPGAVSAGTVTDIPLRPEHAAGRDLRLVAQCVQPRVLPRHRDRWHHPRRRHHLDTRALLRARDDRFGSGRPRGAAGRGIAARVPCFTGRRSRTRPVHSRRRKPPPAVGSNDNTRATKMRVVPAKFAGGSWL